MPLSLLRRFSFWSKGHLWLVRWSAWEYWPLWLTAIPIVGMYLWFALRARHLFFFSNVNPAIPLGGAAGESKRLILDLLPPEVRLPTAWIPARLPFEAVLERLAAEGISFPVVVKPDVGERGFLVKKADTPEALREHLQRYPVDFLVQPFVGEPVEAAVMFCLCPDGNFTLLSVCLKEFLTVTGDGHSTVLRLLAADARAALQIPRLRREQPHLLEQRLAPGQMLVVEPIGNHARGTKFVNACHLIDASMTQAFGQLCQNIPGIRFGRFDLKCASVEALKRAEGKVLEINGILSDPAHVFDPEYGAVKAYCTYYRQWRLLYELHRLQRQAGVQPTPHCQGLRHFFHYFRYKKNARRSR